MSRILVVDDDEAIRDVLKDLLFGGGGHSIDTAADGDEAIKRVSKRPYDLIILDKHMPGLSGLETLSRLKKLPNAKGARVLMCTAADTLSDVDEALSAGADDYISKPIDTKRLAEKAAKWAAASTVPADAPGGLGGLVGRLFGPK
ncbi:MAG: response regulator [Elusimicrobia bacterium]|nr:response regulator [Elusimicrobiota bacterium]